MIKPKMWKGQDLEGVWHVTYKIDGVRMLRDEDGNPISRSNKPLYNLEEIPEEIIDAEIYYKDWESSVSLVRTKHTEEKVLPEHVYSLSPALDLRLYMCKTMSPSKDIILNLLEEAVAKGYEGLVLRQEDAWLKVKPKETYDVLVTGLQEGTNKNLGKLGAFITGMGKVGTGFTDQQRTEYWNTTLIGETIEVECMSLTSSGRFRHPVFKRIRWDK